MKAHFVGLRREPGKIQASGTVLPRSHTVFPVKAGNKVAARIADQRHVKIPDQLHHVFSETQLIRKRMIRFIYTAVDGTAQMLDKGAEQALVDTPDPVIPVQNNTRFFFFFFYPFTLPDVMPAINVFWAKR